MLYSAKTNVVYHSSFNLRSILKIRVLGCFCGLFPSMIIFGKFSQDYHPKKIWLFIHIPAIIIIGIALIYDLFKVPSTSGIGGLIMYYFIMFCCCLFFIISSIKDYKGIQSQIDLAQNKLKIIPLQEETDVNISKKNN